MLSFSFLKKWGPCPPSAGRIRSLFLQTADLIKDPRVFVNTNSPLIVQDRARTLIKIISHSGVNWVGGMMGVEDRLSLFLRPFVSHQAWAVTCRPLSVFREDGEAQQHSDISSRYPFIPSCSDPVLNSYMRTFFSQIVSTPFSLSCDSWELLSESAIVRWQGSGFDWKGNDMTRPKSNFSDQKVFAVSSNLLIPLFVQFSLFLSSFLCLAELLSACHELRCRYGCVMTRNGTFCFCADGFEVGEDGTSCRGRTPPPLFSATLPSNE